MTSSQSVQQLALSMAPVQARMVQFFSQQAPTISSAGSTTFTVGSPSTFTITSTGSPTATISESGSLPTGVTFVNNGDGTATLSGTPAAGTAGTYHLTITAANGLAPNATQSFTLTVSATSTPPDLAQSVVQVSSASIVSGSTTTVTLIAKDSSGTQLTSGGLTVAFGLGAGTAQGTFGSVSDHGNGTYTATFTGTTAGTNTITATIGGQAVTSAAPTINVTPGTISTAKSVVSLSPTSILQNNTSTVTLTAKDANGNNLTTGGATVLFALGTGAATGTFSSVTDHGNGTYTATFTGTGLGTRTITATINGTAVTTTAPTITVVGAADPAHSTIAVSPSSVPSGLTTTVTLTAKDANGNQEPAGGLTVLFSLTGGGTGSGTFGSVTDNGDGTYTATFTGDALGTNTISATINSTPVTTTLPTVTVIPSLSQSTVTVTPGSVVSGVANAATVTLTAKDKNGVQAISGGDTIAFALAGGAATGTFSSVIDNGDGTYTATFTGTLAGTSTITATIDGQTVTSTLPTITVTPGLVDVSKSTVSITPASVESGIADAATVTLTAKDAAGNQLTAGGSTIVFGVTGAATGTFSSVTDHGDGTYTATFTGDALGTGTVTATVDGNSVTSTLPTVTVTPSLSQSTVAVTPASVVSGVADAATVTLTAKDINGNQATAGGATVAFALTGGTATGTFSSVTDNGDGTYTATFTGILAGTSTITATIDGNAVTSTLPTITVTVGAVDVTKSTVSVTPASVESGVVDAATVTLTSKDAAGNLVTSGGATVLFSLGGGAATGTFSSVTDNGDGTYTATFTGDAVGVSTINATVNGSSVTSTLPTVTVTPSLSQSIISVTPNSVVSGVANAATITLTGKDVHGNLATAGGAVVAFSLSGGTATGVFSSVIDHGDGTYTATFTGVIAGITTITATINGDAVTSTPATITVTPGAVDPAQSTISVSPGSVASGDVDAATVTLTAKDAAGNQQMSGGATIVFSLTGGAATGTFSSVTDNGDGTYTATFTGTLAGTSTITATIDGQTVTSTLPTITVTPGLVDVSKSTISIAPASVESGIADAATVTLTAKDAAGNPLAVGGSSIVFGVTGAATGTFSSVTDNGDGTYTATFTGDALGASTVTATIDGNSVTSTLPTITVTPSASQSTLSVSPGSVVSGDADAATVTLTAKDINGNQATSGGATVIIGLSGGGATGSFGNVIDNGDGTYTATFTGILAGTATIAATINGQPVSSTLPTITVTPGLIDLAHSTVSVTPGSVASGVADAALVTLTAKDLNGNQETSGGSIVAFSLTGGTATGTFSSVTDNGDGTYTATFTGDAPGTSTIVATIDGDPVTSTTPTITVV